MFNPKLTELLESGQFDWNNDKHREAYLRAWVNAPRKMEEEAVVESLGMGACRS